MRITQDEVRFVKSMRENNQITAGWSEPGDPGSGYAWTDESDPIAGDGYLLSIDGHYTRPFALYGEKSDGGYYAFAEDGRGNDIGGLGMQFSDSTYAIEWCQNVIKNYLNS